jgi:hypothetical protein
MDSEDIVRKFHQKRGRIRDPGSGKNSSRIRIPDPGGKKAPDPGSGSATLHLGFPPVMWFCPFRRKRREPASRNILTQSQETPSNDPQPNPEASDQPGENQSEPLENQSEPLENQSEPLENQSEPLENQSEPLENQSEPLENQSEPLENQSSEIKKIKNFEEDVNTRLMKKVPYWYGTSKFFIALILNDRYRYRYTGY